MDEVNASPKRPPEPLDVSIAILGSAVRHVMLVPGAHGRYAAHVREADKPLIEAMIAEALKDETEPAKTPAYFLRPHFVINYQAPAGKSPLGGMHSVLDYFPQGSAKSLKDVKRLRVRHEQVSTRTVFSGGNEVSASNDSGRDIKGLLDKITTQSNEDALPFRRIMILYDHDPDFQSLLREINVDEHRQRFKDFAETCNGGVVLAINDHEINADAEEDKQEGAALSWFHESIKLCFNEKNAQNSVVIVSADALRKCGRRITERGAIEDSVDDVIEMIRSNAFDNKSAVKLFHHFIVVFRETGALHIDLSENKGCVMYAPNADTHAQVHPSLYGRMPGKFTAMVTSVVRELCSYARAQKAGSDDAKLDIPGALRMAVAAYHYHYSSGFLYESKKEGKKTSPFDDYKNMLSPVRRKRIKSFYDKSLDSWKKAYLLASVDFPFDPDEKPNWSRADALKRNGRDFDECLIRIVQYGVEYAFRDFKANLDDENFKAPAAIVVPYSEYGKLILVDPTEIRRFNSLAKLIDKYLGAPSWTEPLCIAVFGAPGTGKSFAVKQIMSRVSPDRESEPLIFNLAQFSSIDQLTEAFHKVQDIALAMLEVPLVVFDEFDAECVGVPLGWLKYFLAPMQDGVFRGKEADYRVGRAIFLFAGGTCETFKQFKAWPRASEDMIDSNMTWPNETERLEAAEKKKEDEERAKRAKLPDFISRLRGHLDVAGVNPRAKGNSGEEAREAEPPGTGQGEACTGEGEAREAEQPGTSEDEAREAEKPETGEAVAPNAQANKSVDPNRVTDDEILKLRRAILLRSALDRRAREIFRNTTGGEKFANISKPMISAFLNAKEFKHGSRSIEAIVQMSRFIDGHYVPSSLPAKELLETHVDLESFMAPIKASQMKPDE